MTPFDLSWRRITLNSYVFLGSVWSRVLQLAQTNRLWIARARRVDRRLTMQQITCEHHREFHGRGVNASSTYTSCRRCDLRLNFQSGRGGSSTHQSNRVAGHMAPPLEPSLLRVPARPRARAAPKALPPQERVQTPSYSPLDQLVSPAAPDLSEPEVPAEATLPTTQHRQRTPDTQGMAEMLPPLLE